MYGQDYSVNWCGFRVYKVRDQTNWEGHFMRPIPLCCKGSLWRTQIVSKNRDRSKVNNHLRWGQRKQVRGRTRCGRSWRIKIAWWQLFCQRSAWSAFFGSPIVCWKDQYRPADAWIACSHIWAESERLIEKFTGDRVHRKCSDCYEETLNLHQ